MRRSLRLPERWFNRGLWIVALVFAFCLIGLGSIVVDGLPHVERQAQRDDFLDQAAVQPPQRMIDQGKRAEEDATSGGEQAALKLQAAQQAYANAREAFGSWVETRRATNLPDQDQELIVRTQALDALNAARIAAQHSVDAQNQAMLDARQGQNEVQGRLDALDTAVDNQLATASNHVELRVFG